MACKDCVYSPICKVYADFGVTDVPYDKNDTCEMFKSKSDFVEVVRCKDCKYFSNDTDFCRKHNKWYCTWDYTIKSKRDFCSYGERKEGAEEWKSV